MRDINTGRGHNGDIYVTEGRDYVPYAEASDDLLAAEDERLKGNLQAIRSGRYRGLLIGCVIGGALIVGGLWWLNTLDDDIVAIISAAIGALTLWVTIQTWGGPRQPEKAMQSGVDEIRQIRDYRSALKSRRGRR